SSQDGGPQGTVGAQHAAPLLLCLGVSIVVTAHPTPPPAQRPALPALRLPLGRRRLERGAAISLAVHGLIIAVLIVHAREVLQRLPGTPGHGGGGGNRPEVNFFTLPTTGPMAVQIPAAPAVALADVRSLPQLKLDLPPPLAKVPGSVAGRTYVVKFWVAADGRVTRVEVDPPITDAAYSREFQQRMMAYQFYPARTRDGRNVASVVPVPLRIGN